MICSVTGGWRYGFMQETKTIRIILLYYIRVEKNYIIMRTKWSLNGQNEKSKLFNIRKYEFFHGTKLPL